MIRRALLMTVFLLPLAARGNAASVTLAQALSAALDNDPAVRATEHLRAAAPMTRTMGESLHYMGRVQSRMEVKVIAQAQGAVRDLPFEEGQSVATGDTVARLAVPDLQAFTDRLQADREYWCERYRADDSSRSPCASARS